MSKVINFFKIQFFTLFLVQILIAYSLEIHENENRTKIVVYWGQDLISDEKKNREEVTLLKLCQSEPVDIVVITFLNDFNQITQVTTTSVLNNPFQIFDFQQLDNQKENIVESVKRCQKDYNVDVFVSLGGADGNYGFNSSDEAKIAASQFSKIFNNQEIRIDGLDLDIEKMDKSGNLYFTDFVNNVRQFFDENKTNENKLLVSGAPECVLPSEYMDKMLREIEFDYLFIQFYNNECNVNNKEQFNWNEWELALNGMYSINHETLMFLGIPGSHSAADNGYIGNWKQLNQVVTNIKSQNNSRFGGISIWEASLSINNYVKNGKGQKINYLKFVNDALDNGTSNGTAGGTTNGVIKETVDPKILFYGWLLFAVVIFNC